MQITPLIIKSQKEAKKVILSSRVTQEGARILSSKSVFWTFKIEKVRSWEANILKQHLLSLGSDAALERDALVKNIETDVLVFGSVSQLNKLCLKLKKQTKRLTLISKKLQESLKNLEKESYVYRAADKTLRIKDPIICGIVNITKDSFSGDGLIKEVGSSLFKLEKLVLDKISGMVRAGAKIIDIGAESSRPFSKRISCKEEIKRLLPILSAVRKRFRNLIISVDTHKPGVAEVAAEEGADVINDITALKSSKVAALVGKHRLGCILMHMQNNPQIMQINPQYRCVSQEMAAFFQKKLEDCKKYNISKQQIMIDPGIGFGKLKEHNAEIINNLYQLKVFGVPIFIGISRKSFIGDIIRRGPQERLRGTLVAQTLALAQGANVLRVHDVKEAKEAAKIFSEITKR